MTESSAPMAPTAGCYFCGPVRNCAPYLERVFANIETLGDAVFGGAYKIIVFYDESSDATLDILKKYQARVGSDKFVFYVNRGHRAAYRTHRIAYARNYCLNYIRAERLYPLFAMLDFDDVNAKMVHPDVLRKYLNGGRAAKWDALSFNTAPHYYDIWGLSIYPYCYSYNHFRNNARFYNIIKDYVEGRLKVAKVRGQLLSCISAFNGFAIYRLDAFNGCKYDGRTNPLLIPTNMMVAHMRAAESPVIYPVYAGVADCRFEDCEHRAFHVQGFLRNGARIRIAPECLFT